MNNKLFIIGNGFDLHHKIASKYSNFASYLECEDNQNFCIAEDYITPERDLWNSLEERFAEIDTDKIEEYANNFLVSYGADEWSDSGHHDYEYEIRKICDAISLETRAHFAEWIRQLEIPTQIEIPVRCIDPNALFLNFNYTPTLQKIYNIPDDQILHIHGAASDSTDEIILGHGWERQAIDLHSQFTDEETDVRVAGGFKLIDDFLSKTFKPTRDIISQNEKFFTNLNSINEVFVLGHSMSYVDELYFKKILDKLPIEACWNVSFYDNDIEAKLSAVNIGIPVSKINLKSLSDL